MLNRNATRHLLLAVSALLLLFIIIGYTLRKRQESVGLTPDTTVASLVPDSPISLSPSMESPSSGIGSLRPDTSSGATDTDDDDLAGWIPSLQEEDPVEEGIDDWRDTFASSGADGEAILGLAPSLSSEDASSLSSMRPPPLSSSPSGGGLSIPAELVDSSSDTSDASTDDDASFLASLPVPGQGTLAPPATEPYSSTRPPVTTPPGGTVSDSTSSYLSGGPDTRTTRPSGSAYTPPGSGDYQTDDDLDDDEWEVDEAVERAPIRPASGGGGALRLPPPPDEPQAQAPRPSESLRIYVVRAGDSLSSIAARELGSSSFADNIFLLNRDVIDDPNHLLVGVRIRLPYANSGDSPNAAPRPNQGLGRTHIVVRGDTLSSIAQQYYGSSVGWNFLYESNRHLLSNPNQLNVGMELAIPPYEQ